MDSLNSSHPISSQLANSMFALNKTINLKNETTCIDISEWQWKIYGQLSWWLEGVAMLIVGSFGIFFNTAAICILLSKELADSLFNILVVSLAIADNMFLLSSVLYHIPYAFGLQIKNTYLHNQSFACFIYPSCSIAMCCSTYMTVILALDRYNSISQPAKYKTTTITTNPIMYVLRYTVPVVVLSVMFNMPKWFDLEIKLLEDTNDMNNTNLTTSNNSTTYSLVQTDLRRNQTYVFWYVNVANFLVTCLIPIMCLTYFNGTLYRRRKNFLVRQTERRKSSAHFSKARKGQSVVFAPWHTQQSIIIHSIVIVFAICHSLRIVLNIEELVNIKASQRGCYRFWTSLAQPISHLLLQINSSANFFIYFVFNKTFTKVLMQKLNPLFRCSWKRNADSIATNTNGIRSLAVKYTEHKEIISDI